jgi:hypothetical protein
VLLHGADVDKDTIHVSESSNGSIEARLTGKGEIGRSRQRGGKQWQPKE